MEYMALNDNRDKAAAGAYEIDTVLPSGEVATSHVSVCGGFSLGTADDKHDLVDLLPNLKG